MATSSTAAEPLAVDFGAVGTVVPALVGAGLGAAAFVRQGREAKLARAERLAAGQAAASAQASAAQLAERSRAFEEMAEALDRLGDAVERADRRAEACEKREVRLIARLRALETVAGITPPPETL